MATVGLLTFICVSDDAFERKIAYDFLARVADELVKVGLQVSVSLASCYVMSRLHQFLITGQS